MILFRRITKVAATRMRSRIFTAKYNPIHCRSLQGTLIGTNSDNNPITKRTLSFSYNWTATIAGTMLFSAASAAIFVEEAHAKEPVPPEFRQKELVILYQQKTLMFDTPPTYLNPWVISTFLDYYDIPYKIVEGNFTRSNDNPRYDSDKVPRLMVDGELIVDSHDKRDIIDNLADKLHLDFAARSVTEKNEERKWRGWVETHLINMVLLNIYRSESMDQGNNCLKRLFVSLRLNDLKKLYNITDEYAAFNKAVGKWVDALNGQDFLGGSKPNLADLAVFGVLRQLCDQSRKDMVENTRVGDWYSRMEGLVGMCSKVQP